MIGDVKEYIKNSIETKERLLSNKEFYERVLLVADKVIETYKVGGKVLAAGNGGSAADAQHFVAELVSKMNFDRAPLNAISLTVNSSVLTAIGNDYGFDKVFSRQIKAIGNERDVFVGISTSGSSLNIIEGMKAAKEKKLFIVGLSGERVTQMDELCDVIIKVPSKKTPLIQESHIMIIHILCEIIEKKMFGGEA